MTSIYRESAPVTRDPDLPYSIPDAAAAVGIGRTVMFTLVKSGRVPTILVGNRRHVAAAEVRRIREHGVRQLAEV
jgi:hypothetical protein